MDEKEIKVTFKTITPLWTGDAWQENKEIRPSSLLGSWRFWFEVICYFCGICNERDFNSQLGRFEKEVNREKLRDFIKKNGNNTREIINYLKEEQNIPLPSIIFGTTNWRSLVRIKNIEYLEDYCFGNKLNLPQRICINKSNEEIKENEDCPKRSNKDWSVFFFSIPYFYGKFQVTFEMEGSILESIFYPLLNFMDNYGYWGGKWNIGYGRLKVERVEVGDWKKEEFQFNDLISQENKSFRSFINEDIQNFNGFVEREERNIKVLKKQIQDSDIKNFLKELIKEKAKQRATLLRDNRDNKELRHKIFGKTGNPKILSYVPQGSKIFPYIYEEENQLKGGFLSVADLLNLENALQGGNNE